MVEEQDHTGSRESTLKRMDSTTFADMVKGDKNKGNEEEVSTKWFGNQNIMWVQFGSESTVRALYRGLAKLKINNMKLLPYVLHGFVKEIETLR